MRTSTAGLCLVLASCGLTSSGDVVLDGSDGIPAISIDQYYRNLPPLSETTPPDGQLTFQDSSNQTYTANIATNSDGSRSLTFSNPNVVVFDETQSRQASQKLNGLNVQAVDGVTVAITTFALKDATQANEPPVDLSGLESLTVALNGSVILTQTDIQNLQAGQTVTKSLTQAQIAPFTQAVKNGTAATAKVDVAATVTQQALPSFPTSVHLIVKGQPSVDVSVVKALGN